MCYDSSGNQVAFPNLVNGSNNCSLGVDFTPNGTKYKLVMSPHLPAAGPATGLASVTCNATGTVNGVTQCVNWTIAPNVNANAGVANLYYFTKNGSLAFIGQYYNTYLINVTNPNECPAPGWLPSKSARSVSRERKKNRVIWVGERQFLAEGGLDAIGIRSAGQIPVNLDKPQPHSHTECLRKHSTGNWPNPGFLLQYTHCVIRFALPPVRVGQGFITKSCSRRTFVLGKSTLQKGNPLCRLSLGKRQLTLYNGRSRPEARVL